MSRRGLLAFAVLLAVVGSVGSYSVNPATNVVTAAPYRGHSSVMPAETTTSTIPYRRTTTTLLTAVLPAVQTPETTAAPRPATTTTVAAITQATTTTLVPTTPCTWSTETFPQLNNTSPTLFVHTTAPAMPNATVVVRLSAHGSSVIKATQVGVADGTGRANLAFPLSLAQLGTQVDLTAQYSSGGVAVVCSPRLHTATLTPSL